MDFSPSHTNDCCPAKHTGRNPHALLLALLVLAGCSTALPTRAENPGYDRPGYGFTPVVLAAGEITLEQGLPDWSRDHLDGVSTAQYSADSVLRVGIGGPLELQLGTSPWNALSQTGAGHTERNTGHGDSTLGLKLALPSPNPAFSWGLLGSVEFTDGAPAFRSARRQYLLGAQGNLQIGARQSLGIYVQDLRSAGAGGTLLALSDNLALGNMLTLYVEAARLHAAGQHSGLVYGAGLAWSLTPRIQLDAGFDHRVSGTAPEWQTNLGIAVYFGH